MEWYTFHNILVYIQNSISFIGVAIILSGVIYAMCQYVSFLVTGKLSKKESRVNEVRLSLGRILILGLEFIVAADLIRTTTAPDYYTVGILAIIVLIRTVLSFSLNREIMSLSKEKF